MEKKRKHINFPIDEEEHLKLKVFATKKNKTIKEILLDSLEKAYPEWKDEEVNSSK